MTEFRIRDTQLNDFAAIKRLNDAFVDFTSEMDIARIEYLHNRSVYHRVLQTLPDSQAIERDNSDQPSPLLDTHNSTTRVKQDTHNPTTQDKQDTHNSATQVKQDLVNSEHPLSGTADQSPERFSIAGFLLAMPPQADYSSDNYQWFDRRYKNFLYVDRIVIDRQLQGIGLGRRLYADIFQFAREHKVAHICCEYNLIPANPISASFHTQFGFKQVGRLSSADGKKIVSMQLATAI